MVKEIQRALLRCSSLISLGKSEGPQKRVVGVAAPTPFIAGLLVSLILVVILVQLIRTVVCIILFFRLVRIAVTMTHSLFSPPWGLSTATRQTPL